jgi:hypothetical protein
MTASKDVTYRRTATFICGHINEFAPPPRVGDKCWCTRCGDYSSVIALSNGWAIKCKGCRYGRFFGIRKREAARALQNHKNKYVNHAIGLYLNNRCEIMLDNAGAGVLPLRIGLDNDGGKIPF